MPLRGFPHECGKDETRDLLGSLGMSEKKRENWCQGMGKGVELID